MPKTDHLLTTVIKSLKDAPSTSARRELIATLEAIETGKGDAHKAESNIEPWQKALADADARYAELESKNLELLSQVYHMDQELSMLDWNPFEDIRLFHLKFGLDYEGAPRLLPDADSEKAPVSLAEFRRKFLVEEAKEYCTATYRGNHSLHLTADVEAKGKEIAEHLADALDALVDTLYVALGNAHLHGFTPKKFVEAWNRVHAKNMEKVRAQSAEQSKRGASMDVIKPEGWVAADLSDLVADHIHQPPPVLELGDIKEPS